ncbi:cytochrome P450 [Stackebrandtia nassauensis]|uniref:Cytochrome P450 n=1 Tax=Stackebrandtia nassauensis (strain DSM 44728 / CIP 108903 / NRRL B-16338 / NBRC 102104 / LLR-40K-21) TaxID=446470 RepID=D3QA73_STANL|nr:cytochrome P450 [Stackebrandtia nassauensis]ADD40785.1 cytochrome P450 [Stackebrandtia nassauensis DSM 44728]
MSDSPILDKDLFIERDPGRPFAPGTGITRLAAAGPVTRVTYADGADGWLVTGHAATRAVLADPRFSARADLVNISASAGPDYEPQPTPPGMFIQSDPPEHTRYRHLLTGEFTVRRMRLLNALIERVTAEHLDAMAADGPGADLVTAFAYPIPALVISELLGVRPEEQQQFQHRITAMMSETDPERLQAGYLATAAYMGELVAAKRSHPTDDVFSGLAASDELSDEELGNIGFLLLGAGFETTANMLSLGTLCLLRHPEQLADWRADPGMTDNAVEELLRYLSIAPGTIRAALEDVELEGQLIRQGESVTVSITTGNRDAARFDDPDTLDLRRKTGGHLAFGHGVHQCLGQQLARVEMRVAFPALLHRFPSLRLAVDPDDVPVKTDGSIVGLRSLPVTWDD